jgi:hypothetical protein
MPFEEGFDLPWKLILALAVALAMMAFTMVLSNASASSGFWTTLGSAFRWLIQPIPV